MADGRQVQDKKKTPPDGGAFLRTSRRGISPKIPATILIVQDLHQRDLVFAILRSVAVEKKQLLLAGACHDRSLVNGRFASVLGALVANADRHLVLAQQ